MKVFAAVVALCALLGAQAAPVFHEKPHCTADNIGVLYPDCSDNGLYFLCTGEEEYVHVGCRDSFLFSFDEQRCVEEAMWKKSAICRAQPAAQVAPEHPEPAQWPQQQPGLPNPDHGWPQQPQHPGQPWPQPQPHPEQGWPQPQPHPEQGWPQPPQHPNQPWPQPQPNPDQGWPQPPQHPNEPEHDWPQPPHLPPNPDQGWPQPPQHPNQPWPEHNPDGPIGEHLPEHGPQQECCPVTQCPPCWQDDPCNPPQDPEWTEPPANQPPVQPIPPIEIWPQPEPPIAEIPDFGPPPVTDTPHDNPCFCP